MKWKGMWRKETTRDSTLIDRMKENLVKMKCILLFFLYRHWKQLSNIVIGSDKSCKALKATRSSDKWLTFLNYTFAILHTEWRTTSAIAFLKWRARQEYNTLTKRAKVSTDKYWSSFRRPTKAISGHQKSPVVTQPSWADTSQLPLPNPSATQPFPSVSKRL